MSDELRDDIAAVIVAMGKADPVDVAQAVIDDLGLTSEWSFGFSKSGIRHPLERKEDIITIGLYGRIEDCTIYSRVVGRWEDE